MNATNKILIVLLLSVSNGYTQWNNDPTVNTPVCTTLGSQQFLPQMASDGSGGAIIAWMETPVDFSSSRIYAQHLSSTGTRLWAAGGLEVSNGSGLFTAPLIVPDGNGGAIISWVNLAGGMVRYYMQKITGNGQLQWTAGGVLVCPATVNQVLYYQLVADGHGGATLIWDDQRAGNNQVFAQHLNANGSLQWPVNGLACSPNFTALSSYDVVADSAGGIILCYTLNTGGLYGNDIMLQHINVNGIAEWGSLGMDLCNAHSDQLFGKITKDTNDHVIVIWQDFRLDPVWSQLYGQRIDSAGNILWQTNGIVLADSVAPMVTISKIVADTKGGALITWLDNFIVGQSTTAHLMALRVNRNGDLVWNKKEIASWQELQLPANYLLVSDYQGGGIISWTKLASYGMGVADTYDLAAQQISADGTMKYPLAGTPVSAVPMNQYYQQLVSDSTGVAIVAWSDLRNNADWDLYASRIAEPVSLPVTWLRFTGQRSGSSVLLTWKTVNEWNNKGFIVQRSSNGTQFDSIGFVMAADISQYSFDDLHPASGINFYRLAQCDIDGTISYSKTIRVDIGLVTGVRVYPNPASERIWVKGLPPNSAIYNANGQKVMDLKTAAMPVNEIDIRKLPPGIYYIGGTRFIKN